MTNKEQLAAALKGAGLQSIRVGSRLFIFDAVSKAATLKRIKAYAIRSGASIYLQDSTVFYKWSAIERAGFSGSERYDWHEDGNRVRMALLKVVVKNNTPVCTTEREEYRDLNLD